MNRRARPRSNEEVRGGVDARTGLVSYESGCVMLVKYGLYTKYGCR
jgi:hypothetical protein